MQFLVSIYALQIYTPWLCVPGLRCDSRIGSGLHEFMIAVRIGRMALWLCETVQSHSSSFYPSTISSALIAGTCQDFLNAMGLCRRKDTWQERVFAVSWQENGLQQAPCIVVLLWRMRDDWQVHANGARIAKCSWLGSIPAFRTLIGRILLIIPGSWRRDDIGPDLHDWFWNVRKWVGLLLIDPSSRHTVVAIDLQTVQF